MPKPGVQDTKLNFCNLTFITKIIEKVLNK